MMQQEKPEVAKHGSHFRGCRGALSWLFRCSTLGLFVCGLMISIGPYHSGVSYNVIRHFVPPTPLVYEYRGNELRFFDHDSVVTDINDAFAFWETKSQPILFLHGHDGAAQQGLNLCTSIHRSTATKTERGSPHVCFIARFHEKNSAYHWSVVEAQEQFTIQCIRVIRELYMRHMLDAPKVSLLAHSLGGCVARNVLADIETCPHMSHLTTIVAPMNAHFGFMTSKMVAYTNFPTPERANPCGVEIIALASGHRDKTVPPVSSYFPHQWLASTILRDVYESYSHINSLFAEPYLAAIAKMYVHSPNMDHMMASITSPFADIDVSLGSATNASATAEIDLQAGAFDLATLTKNNWVRLIHAQAIFIWGEKQAVLSAPRSGGTDYDPHSRAPCKRLEVVVGNRLVKPRRMNHPQPVCVYLLATKGTNVLVRRKQAVSGQASTCLNSGSWVFSKQLPRHPCVLTPSPWVPVDFHSPNAPHTKALILAYDRGRLYHVGVLGRGIIHPTLDPESDPQIVAPRVTIPTFASIPTTGVSMTVVLNLCVDGAADIVVTANLLTYLGDIAASYMGNILSLAVAYTMIRSNNAPWWTYFLSLSLLLLAGYVCDLGQPVLPFSVLPPIVLLGVGIGSCFCFSLPQCISRCLSFGSKTTVESVVLACFAVVSPHIAMPSIIVYSGVRGLPQYLLVLMLVAMLMHGPSLIFMAVMNDSFNPFLDAFTIAVLSPVASAFARPKIHQIHRRVDITLGICAPLCFNRTYLLGYLVIAALLHHAIAYPAKTWMTPDAVFE